MSSFINNKEKSKESKDIKYYYFIPSYDVLNNEIYFFEFFTEKIVCKAKKNIKNRKNAPLHLYTIKNMFESGKLLRRAKERITKKRSRKGVFTKESRKIKTDEFALKQFSSNKDSKNFINDESDNENRKQDMKKINSEKKKEIKKKRLNLKREKMLLEIFSLNWQKMKIISGFNENNYVSSQYFKYFSRPFFSKFLIGQNLQYYSFNSTVPLSKAISKKPYINIYIYYDFDNYFNSNQNKRGFELTNLNNIKSEFQKLSDTPRRISLFYIVDTLIKDSIKVFENYIYILLGNFDKESVNTNLDDFIKKESKDSSDISNSESDDDLNEINQIDEDKKKFYELLNIKKTFAKMKENSSFRFILKVIDSEEYLYGDYTLGSYSFIRNKVRQHEGIRLMLKYIPYYKIQPPIFSFPPIIRVAKNDKNDEITYENLFDLYIELYPEHEIIYRINKTSPSQLSRYLKKDLKRTKHLIKYTESGDCDFPLKINICNIANIDKFREWLDNDAYNNIQIILPYFNTLKKKLSISKRSSITSLVKTVTQCFKKNEEGYTGENMNQNYNLHNDSYENFISKYKKNKNDEKEMLENLNNCNFISYRNEKKSNEKKSKEKKSKEKKSREKKSNEKKSNEKYSNIIKVLTNFYQPLHLFEYEKDSKLYSNEDYKKKKEQIVKPYHFNENYISVDKFFPFKLDKYPSLCIPIYIRITIYLLYGSFCIKKFATEPFLLKDFILVNESIVLDGNYCLISHLPYETRIGISIKAYDQKLEDKYVLGSCQIPLYKENGEFQSGEVTYALWPNVKIFPRVTICTPFSKIKKNEKKEKKEKKEIDVNDLKLPILEGSEQVIKTLQECKESVSYIFPKMLQIEEEENKLNQKISENKNEITEDEEEEKEDDDMMEYDKKVNKIECLNDYRDEYPLITIRFPKFSSPLIHNVKNSHSYKNYLEIKYKFESQQSDIDFKEIRTLYGNSHKDIKKVINNMYINNKSDNKEYKDYVQDNQDKIFMDIWENLKKTLPSLIKILKKDPLEKLEEDEIKAILLCRDYISTIPSALELFLRAINWCNPLEVSIAHKYLKKWTKIDGEDALSLLDARFPDTQVREYAINILREFPDEMIDNLMLMLCQCLLYETFLINPLSDFLIERSLLNPKLIGNSFIWFNRVNMKNPIFEERLSAYILQLLMLSGNTFLSNTFNAIKFNYYLELLIYGSKKETVKNKLKIERKNKGEKKENPFLIYYNKAIIGKKKQLPLDPSYICYKLTNNENIVANNMINSIISFMTGKNKESPERKIVLRIGNDLRQDVLAIQMLKIMDKLWLDNNLDLKLITFKILPTEIFAGYIEFVKYSELYKIQNSSGVISVLDKEFIIKYLRGSITDDQSDNEKYENKIDNYIKSLAGYCVATCVLGITERTFRNVMIKNNGILLHINLGHLLGHFKHKCGIKTERSLFLLTSEMANVYICENKEDVFKKCCVKAFNILRHNASKIINPFIIMSAAGLPEFYSILDINHIKKMLVLDKPNDEDAGNYFVEQIWKCKNEKLRQIDSLLGYLKK